jgi:hypothetical protein
MLETSYGAFSVDQPPSAEPTFIELPDGKPLILNDSLTMPTQEWVEPWQEGSKDDPAIQTARRYVVASQVESPLAIESSRVLATTTECAAVNGDIIKQAITENDLYKQIPLLLIQEEKNDNGSPTYIWGRRRYVAEVEGTDDDIPEEGLSDWLDPINVAMRYSTIKRLGVPAEVLMDTPEEFLPMQQGLRENGAKAWGTIGVLPGPDGWTIRTVRMTEQAIKANGAPDYDKLPMHYFQIVACPPKNPLTTLFYKDSGKGTAAEVVEAGEQEVRKWSDEETQPMSKVRQRRFSPRLKRS